MSARELKSAREAFRRASRAVCAAPADAQRHAERVDAALVLDGAEPLQGALVDWLRGCVLRWDRVRALLQRADVRQRLAPFVVAALTEHLNAGRRLPPASAWATRWSVLVAPSLDVPQRAVLCSVDDSRRIAAAALPVLLAGDAVAEHEFLTHCEGARDALAFMLVRRGLLREGQLLSASWDAVSAALVPVSSSRAS